MKESTLVRIDKIEVPDKYLREKSHALAANNRFLAQSLKAIGLRFPISVKERGRGYVLVDGTRRIAAAKMLRWDEIPAYVIAESDRRDPDTLRYQLNAQRENLKPMDEARLIRTLIAEEGLSVNAAAQVFGKKVATLKRYFDVLKVNAKWQKLVNAGTLSLWDIQTISPLSSKGQRLVYDEIKRRGLPFNNDTLRAVTKSIDPIKRPEMFTNPNIVASTRISETMGHPPVMKKVESVAKMRVVTSHRQKLLKRYEDEIAAALPVIKKAVQTKEVYEVLPTRTKNAFTEVMKEYK